MKRINHARPMHVLVKAPTQKSLHDFLRVLTGQIAQRITRAVRGKKNKCSFWLRPAWKRLVHWGRDFFNVQIYIYQNQLETLGLIPYQPRIRKPLPLKAQAIQIGLFTRFKRPKEFGKLQAS